MRHGRTSHTQHERHIINTCAQFHPLRKLHYEKDPNHRHQNHTPRTLNNTPHTTQNTHHPMTRHVMNQRKLNSVQ